MENKILVVEDIKRIEWSNQPVLMTAPLAQFYETTPARLIDNFNANKERFVEGKHYFKLEGVALAQFKDIIGNSDDVPKNAARLILWTKRGAARHAKMLNTDKAWEVFEELEDNYFDRPAISDNQLVALERERLNLERDRLNFEREQFNLANSEESKNIAKVQLIRELASASGENQSLRTDLIKHAAKLLIGEDFDLKKTSWKI